MARPASARLDADELERQLTALGPTGFASLVGLQGHREGSGFKALSPTRNESDASYSVTIGPQRNTLRGHDFGTGETTDAHGIVAAVHRLDVQRQFPEVLEIEARLLGRSPGSPAPPRPTPAPLRAERAYPPTDEVQRLWDASTPVNPTGPADESDVDAAFFVRRRGWWPDTVAELDLVRRLPLPNVYAWPPWWPRRWTSVWRLVARLFDSHGTMRSLAARAVIADADPKSRCPLKCRASGLVFADALGVRLLRGELVDAPDVMLVEGMTDFVSATLWCSRTQRPWPVLGIIAGSARALSDIRWPRQSLYRIWTDPDEAGDGYGDELVKALPRGARFKRVKPVKCEVANG